MIGDSALSAMGLPRRSPAVVGALVIGATILAAAPLQAQWQGEVILQGRVFRPMAGFQDLANHEAELVFTGGYYRDWDEGRQALTVEPFLRLDPSGERSRLDFFDLSWEYRWKRWDLSVGFREVFWGVTESRHLVDVINQRDVLVGASGYVKMGQPLVGVTTRQYWGSLEVMLMPYFREQTFAGRASALWSPIPVAADEPQYQSAARNWHLDAAVRWSHSLGAWDVAATHFAGTNRDPRFVPGSDSGGRPALQPHYDVINQTGVDVQWTRGSWLWKLEVVTLDPVPGRYYAVVGGLEFAVADYLSVFGEYAYDSREDRATTSVNDDFFIGAQLLLPDGRVRAGGYVDRRTLNSLLHVRAERRLSDVSLIALEVGGFLGRASLEPPCARRQHYYLSMNVVHFF
jgi:hypothetical protein